jgi:uncharacterized Zn finger protein
MSRYDGGWPPYVPVAVRRTKALREMEKLRKKGEAIEPVEIEGRTIARSFWGKGWCNHVDSFGDYSNRLPRGRTYVRNGSVCHLGITKGEVAAIVSGSELYNVRIRIKPLAKSKWEHLKKQCTGKIGSLIELLQGKLSDEIMGVVTDRKAGLFPQSGEISYECTCPDWAGMCKHIAAVIYGIGVRLDKQPELLFLLRGTDHEELISADATAAAITGHGSKRSRRRSLANKDLGGVFGVELELEADAEAPLQRKPGKKKPSKPRTATKTAAKQNPATKKTAKTRPAPKRKTAKRAPAPFRPTAAAVAQLRRRLAMTKTGFARAVGVSATTITNWENAAGPINPKSKGLAGLNRLHLQQKSS